MKKILLILCMLPMLLKAQYSATFTQTSVTATNDPLRPGVGLNDYFNVTPVINWPNPAVNAHAKDLYFRITWDELSKGWGGLDAFFNQAIDRGQKVIFRIVTADNSYTGNTVSGARMAYPIAVHNAMQGEANPDYIAGSGTTLWFPNWNSSSYLTAWEALLPTVRTHLNNTSRSGVAYIKALMAFDISGIGIYGEGHRFGAGAGGSWPTGTQWTLASLQRIVNAQKATGTFDDIPLVGNINFLNTNSELPSGFGSFYLTSFNSWGPYGMRWDHVCDKGTYDFEYTNKTTVENGINFKTEEGNIWKRAIVLGEPQQFNFSAAGQCDYYHSLTEALTYHASMIENANNIMNGGAIATCTADLFRSIAVQMGYRYTILNIVMTDSLIKNGNWNCRLNMSNIGIAPTYEIWDVVYEFWQGGSIAFSFASTWQPKLILPGTFTVIDNHIMPATISGIYNIQLSIRPHNGYGSRMPLQINTRQADGSYLLRSAIGVATQGSPPPPPPPPPPNQPPVVIMGADQTDTLPKNVDTLTAQVSDPNSDAVTVTWTQLAGGPNTATITTPNAVETTITGLIEGTYSFRLTANDGHGGISSKDVHIFVFDVTPPPPPPPPPPIYNAPTISAGADTTIQLPADSAILHATILTQDTTIASYSWTKFVALGGTIVSPTAATTRVTGLPAGNYIYRLRVTDRAGNVVDDYINVRVLPIVPVPPPPLPSIPDKIKPVGPKAF